MSNQEEFVVFMTLPRGVDESIIPGVLATRGIPVRLSERYLARQATYVEIQVPASGLEDARRALEDAKRIGEKLKSGSEALMRYFTPQLRMAFQRPPSDLAGPICRELSLSGTLSIAVHGIVSMEVF